MSIRLEFLVPSKMSMSIHMDAKLARSFQQMTDAAELSNKLLKQLIEQGKETGAKISHMELRGCMSSEHDTAAAIRHLDEYYKGNKTEISNEHLRSVGQMYKKHNPESGPSPMSYGGQYARKDMRRAEHLGINVWLRYRDDSPVKCFEFSPHDAQVGLAATYNKDFQEDMEREHQADFNEKIKQCLPERPPSLQALIRCLEGIDPRCDPVTQPDNFANFKSPDDKNKIPSANEADEAFKEDIKLIPEELRKLWQEALHPNFGVARQGDESDKTFFTRIMAQLAEWIKYAQACKLWHDYKAQGESPKIDKKGMRKGLSKLFKEFDRDAGKDVDEFEELAAETKNQALEWLECQSEYAADAWVADAPEAVELTAAEFGDPVEENRMAREAARELEGPPAGTETRGCKFA